MLAGFGIDAEVVAHRPAGEALRELVVSALETAPTDRLILRGRAQTIAPLRAAIKAASQNNRPAMVKAYWDEKRCGLD